tara:strand:- start:18359 stop:20788 length:2430 start_codon:yes stop_codon:yes gene_type:complete
MEDKLLRQLKLEEEMGASGYEKFMSVVEDARERGEETRIIGARDLMANAVVPVAEVIENYLIECETKAGKNRECYKYLKRLKPEHSAFLALKHALNTLTKEVDFGKLCLTVGRAVQDEINYQTLKEANPVFYRTMQKDLQQRTSSTEQRSKVMQLMINRSETKYEDFGGNARAQIGLYLMHQLMETTGYFKTRSIQVSKTKRRTLIEATPRVMEWLGNRITAHAELCVTYKPLIIPPKPWTSIDEGGYWSGSIKLKAVKSPDEAYLKSLTPEELSVTLETLNHLGETSWQINKGILAVMRSLIAHNSQLGGLINIPDDKPELPPKPFDIETNEEARKKWKKQASEAYAEHKRKRSKYLLQLMQLGIAEAYQDEDEIFFCYNVDFRGRVYAVQLGLTPQGSDISKALLRFSKGVPLGESGARWLAIHGANVYGEDKCSLDDRVRWVEDNKQSILDSAEDPLKNTFWTQADKPYQFLAFCFEWKEYLATDRSADFKSHIPVALDGSCNGLQHYSAMLRDKVGGDQVNLTDNPEGVPRDIYGAVAEVVKAKVEASDDPELRKWLPLISRGLCKQPVMTMVYGSTLFGIEEQLKAVLVNMRDKGKELPEGFGYNLTPDCKRMSVVVNDSIGEVVVKSREAMDWIQESLEPLVKANTPMEWHVPTGFRIKQEYRKPNLRRVQTTFDKVSYRISYAEGQIQDKLNVRQQRQGISPNFIHSMDASALMLTTVRCKKEGVNDLHMIHDSYGTHAGNTQQLFDYIREEFVRMYEENNVLEQFKQSVERRLPEGVGIKPIPPMGDLDLRAVLTSKYFFA